MSNRQESPPFGPAPSGTFRDLISTATGLAEGGRNDEAEYALRMAASLRPQDHLVHFFLAQLLYRVGRLPESRDAYQRSVQCAPRFHPARGGLLAMQRALCDFAAARATERELVDLVRGGESVEISPTDAFGIAALTAPELRQINERFARRNVGEWLNAAPMRLDRPTRRERLTVGYLSCDFHDHATMRLLIGVLERHDRRHVRVLSYSTGPDVQDHIRQRLVATCEAFRDVSGLTDAAAAQFIAADGVDVLVDLNGPLGWRQGIVALRPAPVAINWLGFPGTFGHPRLADYVLGDPVVTPPGSQDGFSEQVVVLPNCYQPNDRDRVIGPASTRQSQGLPEDGFVFCSFNQPYKTTGEMFTLWCALLARTPGSVLWLLDPEHDEARASLRNAARVEGVDPARLVFAQKVPAQDHLSRLRLADLALDTFPVSSHTTASDALWAGVPLVSRIGSTFASRVAASLLNTIGLPELIAETTEAYLQLALHLALRPDDLAAVRNRLRANRLASPLFDTDLFVRNLESAYEAIWAHRMGNAA